MRGVWIFVFGLLHCIDIIFLMEIIENKNVKEKLYIEKLENGLNILIIPKKDIKKKYVMKLLKK